MIGFRSDESEGTLLLVADWQAKLTKLSSRRLIGKADWDFWANRVTLSLALVGSIFGILAFFKK